MTTNGTPLLVFDQNLVFIAQIDNYQYLRWERNWRKPHEWEFVINRNINGVDNLLIDNWVAIYVGSKYRIGQISSLEVQLDQNGKASENFVFSGFDASGDFYNRLALHLTTTGNGYDEITSANCETVMRHYVDTNAVNPTDINRKLQFLSLGTNLNRGSTISYRGRFQTIAEILEEVSFTSVSLGYETTFNISGPSLTFNVLQGVDRSYGNGVNNPVVFSTDYDNVEVISFKSNKKDSRNIAIVGGPGEAQDRTQVQVPTSGGPTGRARREVFVDARDLQASPLAPLISRGQARLNELGIELDLELKILQQGPFQYLVDYDLGDIVTAIYPGIAQQSVRIIQAVEEYTIEKGLELTLGFGREFPDIKTAIKQFRNNTITETRR